jgi:hypothetical protein
MFKRDTVDTSHDILTDADLEIVSGGFDATAPDPTNPLCPPPFVNFPPPHNPDAPIWKH